MEPKSPGNFSRGSGEPAHRNSGPRPRSSSSTRRSWGRR
jgi:hypothetical protein